MNDNCLKGMRCPKCKNDGRLRISTTCWAEVVDDGVDESYEHAWDEESACICPSCHYIGKVADFTIKRKRKTGKKED